MSLPQQISVWHSLQCEWIEGKFRIKKADAIYIGITVVNYSVQELNMRKTTIMEHNVHRSTLHSPAELIVPQINVPFIDLSQTRVG